MSDSKNMGSGASTSDVKPKKGGNVFYLCLNYSYFITDVITCLIISDEEVSSKKNPSYEKGEGHIYLSIIAMINL